MKSPTRLLLASLMLASNAGCAGGWRGGAPPSELVSGAGAAAPAAAPAAGAAATHATADGAFFVWTGEGGAVAVAGEFNAWSTSADPLKKQGNGSWTLEKKLAPGRYAYKFVIDGTNWKPDPGAAEGVDDGFGGKNSLVVVGAAGAAAPKAAAMAPAPAAKTGAGPAVTAGGAVFRFSGAGGSVNLAGEFNAWSTSADALVKQADGSWAITKKLAPGRYMYKFVIDGTTWKEDAAAAEFADDGFGGKNSVVVVGGAAGTAAPAPAMAAAAPATRPLAHGVKPRAPQPTADGIVFTFAGAAKSVGLCGEFNAWSTTTDPMTQQADGSWTITKKLAPGAYAYKFLIDGSTWKPDEGNTESRDDGFGGKNSVVTVK